METITDFTHKNFKSKKEILEYSNKNIKRSDGVKNFNIEPLDVRVIEAHYLINPNEYLSDTDIRVTWYCDDFGHHSISYHGGVKFRKGVGAILKIPQGVSYAEDKDYILTSNAKLMRDDF